MVVETSLRNAQLVRNYVVGWSRSLCHGLFPRHYPTIKSLFRNHFNRCRYHHWSHHFPTKCL